MAQQRRNAGVDCLKGISCIAVLFIHYNFPGNLGLAVKTFFRFAVPVFFGISGYYLLTRDDSTEDIDANRIVRKIKHIGWLTIVAGVFFAVFHTLYSHATVSGWSRAEYMQTAMPAGKIVKLIITNDPFAYAHLWFLLALIYCYVFCLFFNSAKMRKYYNYLIPLLLVGYYSLQEFGGVLHISRSVPIPDSEQRLYLFNLFIFRALPFFLIGVWLREHHRQVVRIMIRPKTLVIAMVLGSCLAVCERFLFEESQFYLGTLLTFISMFVFVIKYPDRQNAGLAYIGRELSTYVYILHIAVGKTIDLLFSKMHVSQYVVYKYSRAFLILGVTLLCAWGISTLVKRCKKLIETVKSAENL